MIRVVYNNDDKAVVTVLESTDGTTVYPADKSVLEDTPENIMASAGALGIDTTPIQEFLDQQV